MIRTMSVLIAMVLLSRASLFGAIPELINIDFNGNVEGACCGSNPGITATGAAAIGDPGDIWNGVNNTNGAGQALVSESGAATSVTVDWAGGSSWNLITNLSPNPDLSNDFFVGTGSVTLHNVPSGSYSLYLYSTDDVNSGGGRSTDYTVTGYGSQHNFQVANVGSWVQNDNYTLFAGISPDINGDILISFAGSLNGLQLIPEPASALLFTLGGLGLIRLARKRRRRVA